MSAPSKAKRIWGWFFFDWASQPYNTLLITFIFAPYIKELIGDGAQAQTAWGFGVGTAGLIIAILAPVLGAMADTSGNRLRWIWFFSVLYFVGAYGLWYADPANFNLVMTLTFFAIGMIGMEFATIFTNSMLPDLGTKEEIGRISGNGWAFGYLGGLLALAIMLVVFAESAETGKTFVGLEPPLGLDPEAREGTRFVGPLTAVWYAVFMIPFFLWVKDPKQAKAPAGAVKKALVGLGHTIRALPLRRSLFAYLGSSMLYRDALNGLYAFGGIYAAGVLNWSVVDTGVFGIIAIIAGAVAAWLGGRADERFGPKPVIRVSIIALALITLAIATITPTSIFFVTLPEGSGLSSVMFYLLGAGIGAFGGTLQTASRTMMVRQFQ